MGLEDIVVDHRDVLPAGDVSGLHLLGIAELAEDLVRFIMKGEHPEAVVVKVRHVRINACLNEPEDILGQMMALVFNGCHKIPPADPVLNRFGTTNLFVAADFVNLFSRFAEGFRIYLSPARFFSSLLINYGAIISLLIIF